MASNKVNKAFEKESPEDATYKNFSGIFDLSYCPAGEKAFNFSVFEVGEKFGTLFTSCGCRIWWALHDKDTFNGEKKVPHVHYVISFHRKRRWSAAFRELCRCFGVPEKVHGVKSDGEFAFDDDGQPVMVWNSWLTMSACVSLIGAIRYLVHASDKDKYQYGFDSIYTNDVAMAKMAMLCKEGALTSDVITKLVWDCHGNIRVICNLLGLDYFQKYNSTIRMLVNQYRYENDGYTARKVDVEVDEPKFA